MKIGKNTFYKLVRTTGWDFYTGRTINYADNVGKVVKAPKYDKGKGLCSSGVIHASREPLNCFVGASIPCRAFAVTGHPILDDGKKCGFKQLRIVSEVTDLDSLFEFKYSEAVNPINPFKLSPATMKSEYLELIKKWASVRASVWASVWDSVGAYIGSLFPDVKKIVWKYINYDKVTYPFQSAADLWKVGIVPSYDGKIWRLHTGEKAIQIWAGEVVKGNE